MYDWKIAILVWSMGSVLVLFLHHIASLAVIMEKKENGKNKILGIAIIHRKKEYFSLKIRAAIMKRAETTGYCLMLPKKFIRENYMEELVLETAEGKISCRIDSYIGFILKE